MHTLVSRSTSESETGTVIIMNVEMTKYIWHPISDSEVNPRIDFLDFSNFKNRVIRV